MSPDTDGSDIRRVFPRINIALILTIIGIIATFAIQWSNFQRTVELADQLELRLRQHEQDSSRHVDQFRDEQRYRELVRRLDRIEDKIDGR